MWRRRSGGVPCRHLRGVVAAHAVRAGAGVRVARAEVEPAHGRAIAEVRKDRPKDELVIPRVRAAAEIAPAEVRVHRLEIGRREVMPREDGLPKARRERFDALLDAIGEALRFVLPAARVI